MGGGPWMNWLDEKSSSRGLASGHPWVGGLGSPGIVHTAEVLVELRRQTCSRGFVS